MDAVLDGHDQLRRDGRGRVSVLIGPPAQGAAMFRKWCAARDRACAEVRGGSLEALVDAWAASLSASHDLWELLAKQLGVSSPPRPTAHELAMALDARPPADPRTARIWEKLIEAAHAPDGAALAPTAEPLARADALAALLPARELPGLLVAADRASPAAAAEAAGALAALAEGVASLPLALAVDREAWREIEGGASSHARAVLAEGVIELEPAADGGGAVRAAAAAQPEEAPSPLETTAALEGGRFRDAAERVRALGASQRLVTALERAARAVSAAERDASDSAADRARSEAERLLFEALEHAPATRGRFRLNAPGGFRFGRTEAEIDLLAARERVAVEIDGPHHFRDAEAYRRDRRKDYEMQKRGLLVLRFLASDVVERLGPTLDTVRGAITTPVSII